MIETIYKLYKKIVVMLICIITAFNNIPIFLITCSGETVDIATFDELNSAIINAQDNDIIYVTKNITIPSSASNTLSTTAYLVAKKKITIEGKANNITIKREGGKSILECNGSGAVVSLRNIIFDGGAVWNSDTVSDLSNSGISGRCIIDVAAGATLNIESGAIIQNGHATDSSATNSTDTGGSAYGAGARVDWKLAGGGTINVKAGSLIKNCKARKSNGWGYGGGISAYNNAKLNLYGGTIEGCYASTAGGAIATTYRKGTDASTSGVINMSGGILQNNESPTGGAICFEGASKHTITGGTITNNKAENGGAILLSEDDTLSLASKGSTLIMRDNSINATDVPTETYGYESIYKNSGATINLLIENKKVVFNTNGGNSLANLYVEKGKFLGESFPGAPIRNGYIFLGWFTDNGTFQNQFTSSSVVNEDITVYAKWIAEDTTKPQITSMTLKYEKDGNEINYTSGIWTKSPITVTYTVTDPHTSGAITSGIDKENYQISLNGGTNYYNATSSISGVGVLNRTESELKLKISKEGESNLKIKVADKDGNIFESSSANLRIDTTKPNAPTNVESTTANIYSNNNKPTILGKGEAGCTVNIKENSTLFGSTTVAQDGSWQISVNALSNGVHTLLVTQTDLAGNTSDAVSIVFKIDTHGPTGEINIRENNFTKFLNTITFGMFFKQNVEVKFESSDEANGSGVKKTEYLCLKLDENTREFQTEADAIKAGGWTEVPANKSFTMSGDNLLGKFVIYARITDNAGNVTCINSNGVVVYKDSTTTVDTLTFKDNLSAVIALNGNTINKITNSIDNKSELLTLNKDYSVVNSTITFNNSYLKGLSAGVYTLDVYFNPAGVAFNPADGSNSDTPNQVSIKLTVQKGTQKTELKIVGIDSSNSYTYGDNSFQISTTGGDGNGEISYLINNLDPLDETEVSTISADGTVNILKAGTFTITATKASDETYLDQSVTSSNIVVNPHAVTITELTANDKIYDGTNKAEISGTPQISWIHKDDGENEVKVDLATGQALFDDENVKLIDNTNIAQPKPVAFSGFSLTGTKASSYSLSQPSPTTATIRQKDVTITGVSAEDKDYDGKTNTKIIVNQDAKIDGKLDNDDLNIDTANATTNFENKNAGKNKTVKFSGFTISGDSKDNYNLKSQPADAAAEIRAKELHVSVSAENKKYDGLKTAKIFASLDENELVSGDTVELTEYGNGEFENIGPCSGVKVAIFPEFSLKETETVKNYSLVQPDPNEKNPVTANIEDGFSPEESTHYTLNTPDGSNFWYVHNNFIITAKGDYVISTDNKDNSDWKSVLSYSEQTAGTKVTFFVRNINTKEILGVPNTRS